MATYYVSSLAGGSGDGSSGNPWTLDQARTGVSSGDTVYVKADGVYSRSAAFQPSVNNVAWIGYTTTPGDNGVATIRATSGSGYYVWDQDTGTATFQLLANLDFDGDSIAKPLAISRGGCVVLRCRIRGGQWFVWGGLSSGVLFAYTEIDGAAASGSGHGSHLFYRCRINSNGMVRQSVLIECVVDSSVSAPTDRSILLDCTIVGADLAFLSKVSSVSAMLDCVVKGSTSKVFESFFGTTPATVVDRLRTYSNASFGTTGSATIFENTACAADPVPNSGSDDFSPSSEIQGQSYTVPGGGTTSYPDIGAVQHQDSGGGGGATFLGRGILSGGNL